MEKKQDKYTTYAFISYSHRDISVAKWLQNKLEAFKLPTEIHNDIDAGSRYLRPVFRDQSDLNTGILSDELRKHLKESRFLILLCSKNSARSAWVSDEAKAFVEMGRLDRIIPVIIPNQDVGEEVFFPEFLRNYFREHPEKELLGVNLGEEGKEKALIRIISRMLDVSFDSLWKRHQRQKRIRIITSSAMALILMIAAYLFAVPVSVTVNVTMQHAELPIGEKVSLNVDGGKYVSNSLEPHFEKISIPGYKRFSDQQISVSSQFFIPADTAVSVGLAINRDIYITLKRDDSFAIYAGTVYDDELKPLQDVTVTVGQYSSFSDSRGYFHISIPLMDQRAELPITLEKAGFKTINREDESPGKSIKFIMHTEIRS